MRQLDLLIDLFIFVVSDDVPRFRTRGTIQLKAGRENSVALSQMELSDKDRSLLKVRGVAHSWGWSEMRQKTSVQNTPTAHKKACMYYFSLRDVLFENIIVCVCVCVCEQDVAAVDGLYRIRVPRVSPQSDRQSDVHLSAFVRAVCLICYDNYVQWSAKVCGNYVVPQVCTPYI